MKFKAREGASSVSFGGKEYKVGKDGTVDVPEEAAADLASHGFVPVAEKAKDDDK